MPKELADIVCAIAGPITQRTLENLRRQLEDLYVKSTAQGSSLEEQAAFNPALIAQAHQAAMEDNAKTVTAWAAAIFRAMTYAQSHTNRIAELERYIQSTKDKIAYLKQVDSTFPYAAPEESERYKAATASALQKAEEELSGFEKELLKLYLRDLRQSAPPLPGYPSYQGPGKISPGGEHLDGRMSDLSSEDSRQSEMGTS